MECLGIELYNFGIREGETITVFQERALIDGGLGMILVTGEVKKVSMDGLALRHLNEGLLYSFDMYASSDGIAVACFKDNYLLLKKSCDTLLITRNEAMIERLHAWKYKTQFCVTETTTSLH